MTEMNAFLAPRAQIAPGDHPLEGSEERARRSLAVHSGLHRFWRFSRRRPIAARHDLSGEPRQQRRRAAWSRARRSARLLISTSPAATPRGPTITCHGRPIRSAVANLPPGALVGVVVEHVAAGGRQRGIELLADAVAVAASPGFMLMISDVERRDRLRPDDAVLVVARLDDRRDQARRADAVGAHRNEMLLAVRARAPWRLIGLEYLSPKWKMWPTSMPRADRRLVRRQSRPRPPRRASRRSPRRASSTCRRCRRSRHRRRNRRPRPAPAKSRKSRWQNTWLSPVSARMMNSWLRSPPIGPVSARIGIAFRPMRVKVRR